MAILSVHINGKTKAEQIGIVTTIGRHWSCILRLDHPSAPLFWLEIRYGTSGWAWRPLETRGLTRGSGRPISNGWKSLTDKGGGTARVHCGKAGWVELTDASPPTTFAKSLNNGTIINGAGLGDIVERHSGNLFRMGEGDTLSAALSDGDIFASEGSTYRLFSATQNTTTELGEISIDSPKICVDVSLDTLTATFTQGTAEVTVTGEPVRVLVPFIRARLDETSGDDGWLTVNSAWKGWMAAGGNPNSAPERLAWEKGRLRTQLARAGACNVSSIFEKRRLDGLWWSRIAIPPDRISLK
jgi:hypothetical protein